MRHQDEELIRRIADYIEEIIIRETRRPTVREIGERFNVSKSTAHNYLKTIEKKRLCRQLDKFDADQEIAAKLANGVSCGTPTYEDENIERYIRLPISLFGKGEKYLLNANGDSMINAGINDGDMLVVRKQVTAEPGDIVVALLDGTTTLKRFMRHRNGMPYLHPENPIYPDIEMKDWSTCYIQGVLTHVIKEAVPFTDYAD